MANSGPDFKKIFDWAPGIFLVLLPDAPRFTIIAANQARFKATMSDESQFGKGLFEMFPENPNDPDGTGVNNLRHSLEQVIKTGKPDTMAVQKYDIPRPESQGGGFEERYWSPINSPVFDESGKLINIIHVVTDVTEFVKLKQKGDGLQQEVFLRAQEIQVANTQLQEANEEMGQLYEKVKEMDRIKTEFFANVSHELRTPLTLIMGPVEQLLQTPHLSESERAQLRMVKNNADTLLKHVNDLLDVAKLEAGKMSIHYKEIDVAKFFRLTAANFESVMASKSISFTVSAPDKLIAQLDDEKVHRIIMNILSNAMKFVPDKGRVECNLSRVGDDLFITVADNGPGIRPELREAVFERFRQVEGGATRAIGGTGLGLAIVKDFVELHHGSISIMDTLGGGATFLIKLPVLAPAGEVVSKSESVMAASRSVSIEEPQSKILREQSFDSNKGLVLVVEDNADMREFITQTLETSFNVITASNGIEGLELLKHHSPDLILTDIMMPKMSGDQMIEEIKKRDEHSEIPIVLLTAKMDYDLKLRLLSEGCQDFLSKPFSQKELLIRVVNLIEMKKAREILASELSVKSSDIFTLSRELTLRKRELQDLLSTTQLAKEQAEIASELKTRLLTIVSHELRTPLTSLMLAVEMIKRQKTIEADSKYLRNIFNSGKQLMILIDQLIEYSNVQRARFVTDEKWFSPREVFTELVEEMDPTVRSKGLTIRLSLNLPSQIKADRNLLKIILYNLLSNAIKFTNEGTVSVSAYVISEKLHFEVQDTGQGINEDDLRAIFEPFGQLGPLQNKGMGLPGLGLGLAFIKSLVDALHGSAEAKSAVGKGSTFKIVVPIQT